MKTLANEQHRGYYTFADITITCDRHGCDAMLHFQGVLRGDAVREARQQGWSIKTRHYCPQHRRRRRQDKPWK